jgi:uncharacterized protein (UPF0276 family)
VSTLIEWDDHIPTFERLEAESERARAIATGVVAGGAAVTGGAAVVGGAAVA